MNPFKYLNEINYGKRNIMVDEETEKAYVPFVINRSLSYFPDTVALANEMNRYGHLESRLQFAFLINTIRKRKRFSKWIKPEIENDVEVVKEYYGYSNEKAKSILSLLTGDQIEQIKNRMKKGGRTK